MHYVKGCTKFAWKVKMEKSYWLREIRVAIVDHNKFFE
jgi:hypothetical protein